MLEHRDHDVSVKCGYGVSDRAMSTKFVSCVDRFEEESGYFRVIVVVNFVRSPITKSRGREFNMEIIKIGLSPEFLEK